MPISMDQIKELRSRTGAGVVDVKAALSETGGDVEQAITILRKKGKASAAKKAQRLTREGVVASYVHSNQKIAVLASVLCETDFVARSDRFQQLAKDIAMHIAAADPAVVSPEDVPEAEVEAEKAIALEQIAAQKKPPQIQEKIIEGKLKKFREERALLTQVFVKDPEKTVGDLIHEAVLELGENITVGEFCRITI
ncbi:MAG: elongation factor Ts [Patescibacteria group bacterium]